MTHPEFARVSCGALSANDVDRDVELSGWVHRRRDHGGLIFIDLRDRDGITQITFDPADAATFKLAETLRNEFVVRVRGRVRRRPAGTENPKLADRRDRSAGGAARAARPLGDAAVRRVVGRRRSTRTCG